MLLDVNLKFRSHLSWYVSLPGQGMWHSISLLSHCTRGTHSRQSSAGLLHGTDSAKWFATSWEAGPAHQRASAVQQHQQQEAQWGGYFGCG